MFGDSHEKFISECCEQFGHYADNIQELSKFADEAVKQDVPADYMCTKSQGMADRMCRVVRVLQEYIKKCDRAFNGDMYLLPLTRVHRVRSLVLKRLEDNHRIWR